jgi:hypothetical protein
VASEGITGLYLETRNYGATASFWKSLGFEPQVETDHGSGQWVHPAGGPYVFIAERLGDGDLEVQPILGFEQAAYEADRPIDWVRPFEPQHWGVLEAIVRDPDGRSVSLQAPMSADEGAPG